MVILKCCGAHFSNFLERVVFPFKLLSFQAPERGLWSRYGPMVLGQQS